MSRGYLLAGGTIVTHQQSVRSDVRMRGSRVVEIGDGLTVRNQEVVLDCSGHFLYPGLINAHDHLSFNLFPRLGDPPYTSSYDWGTGIQKGYKTVIDPIQRVPLRLRLFWGAWKNMFSGVTTVAHHDPYFLRFRFGCPLNVIRSYTFAHSLGFEPDMERSLRNRKTNIPFILHLAEGTDDRAAGEVMRLQEMGGIDKRTVAVHAVGIREADVEILQESGASVVWCPASNFFLFNRTAPVSFLNGRVRLALGTDSTLTGSVSMFDELRVAQSEGTFSARELFAMVTNTPQQVLRIHDTVGSIRENGHADLFLLPALHEDPYSTLLAADPGDITALFRNGNLMFHDSSLSKQLPQGRRGSSLNLNGRMKHVNSTRFATHYNLIKNFVRHYSYLG